MSKVTNRAFRAIQVCEVAGVEPVTFSAWRTRHGLLNGDRRGKTARFSACDASVAVLAATLTRRGFIARDAIPMAEHHRPTLEKAMTELVELGRIVKRPRLTLEQEATGGLQQIAPVTFDLAAVAEWVIEQLGIPLPVPSPTTQEAKHWLAYIASPEFLDKLAALKVEIDKRSPRTWTWADVERATGVPEWFAAWALAQAPKGRAHKQISRLLDELPEVRT